MKVYNSLLIFKRAKLTQSYDYCIVFSLIKIMLDWFHLLKKKMRRRICAGHFFCAQVLDSGKKKKTMSPKKDRDDGSNKEYSEYFSYLSFGFRKNRRESTR